MNTKFLYINLYFTDGFIITPNYKIIQCKSNNLLVNVNNYNKTLNTNTTSKIYKLDFDNEDNEMDLFFKPKYLFGLSEYHMTFVRIYVYMTTIIHFIILYTEKIKK
jgi:hypothetical protein